MGDDCVRARSPVLVVGVSGVVERQPSLSTTYARSGWVGPTSRHSMS